MLEYLQVMVFANLFAITSNPQYVQDIKELVLSLLEDDQLEVSMNFTQSAFLFCRIGIYVGYGREFAFVSRLWVTL